MKLSFRIITFNAHTDFFAISNKLLHENMQKTQEPHISYLTTEEKSKPSVRKQIFFLCEVVASKVWCYQWCV